MSVYNYQNRKMTKEDSYRMAVEMKKMWNDTCLAAGIPAVSMDTAASIMTAVYLYGNNEEFVLNKLFLEDLRYIQKRFRVEGGEMPDYEFTKLLQERIKEVKEYDEKHEAVPPFLMELMKERYSIKLRR